MLSHHKWAECILQCFVSINNAIIVKSDCGILGSKKPIKSTKLSHHGLSLQDGKSSQAHHRHNNGDFWALSDSSVVLHGPGADRVTKTQFSLSTNCPTTDHFLFTSNQPYLSLRLSCLWQRQYCVFIKPFHFLRRLGWLILRVNLTGPQRHPVTGQTLFWVPLRVFLGEINIWINRLSKADDPFQFGEVGASLTLSVEAWKTQKGRGHFQVDVGINQGDHLPPNKYIKNSCACETAPQDIFWTLAEDPRLPERQTSPLRVR